VTPTAEEASGRFPSQSGPGLSGARSDLGGLVNRSQQEEGAKDIVILQEEDEEARMVSSSENLEPRRKRLSAAVRRSRQVIERPLTKGCNLSSLQ